MDQQVLDFRLVPIYNSFMKTQDVVLRTYRMRWTRETNVEGESEESMHTAPHDDDDDDIRFNRPDCTEL